MSRLEVFRHHPKRTLTALAAVLAAVGVAIGSGADFTASSSNKGNVAQAGAWRRAPERFQCSPGPASHPLWPGPRDFK